MKPVLQQQHVKHGRKFLVSRTYLYWYTKDRLGAVVLKTTRYFEEQVLRKRPYIRREWCEMAVLYPVQREKQSDGRIRYWILIPELGKYLRVVTLKDGETVHNAFPDRGFKREGG